MYTRHATWNGAILLLLYYCFTTALLLLYYCFTTITHNMQHELVLFYYCFTTALLLLYYCFTAALLLSHITCNMTFSRVRATLKKKITQYDYSKTQYFFFPTNVFDDNVSFTFKFSKVSAPYVNAFSIYYTHTFVISSYTNAICNIKLQYVVWNVSATLKYHSTLLHTYFFYILHI